jgi:hypothetical protein
MSDPVSPEMLVNGSLCWVACGFVVICGNDLTVIPAFACVLSAGLPSFGHLRRDGCVSEKSS